MTDGPDAAGNMFERPALPSDAFVKPFPNDNAARAANGGALPTDLSLITKSRAGWSGSLKTLYTTQLIKGMGGPEYVYSVLTGYQDPPPGCRRGAEGKHYNPYFENGHWIGMPPPLTEGGVTYADGTQATVDQMAKGCVGLPGDGRAENGGAQAHRLPGRYLLVFAVLLYLVKRRIWGGMNRRRRGSRH